jgi:hypothetical protein
MNKPEPIERAVLAGDLVMPRKRRQIRANTARVLPAPLKAGSRFFKCLELNANFDRIETRDGDLSFRDRSTRGLPRRKSAATRAACLLLREPEDRATLAVSWTPAYATTEIPSPIFN